MALRINLSETEQAIVKRERLEHPNLMVRRKMDALWLLHHGHTRAEAADIVGVTRMTVQRYVKYYKDGGLEALCRTDRVVPVSAMDAYRNTIIASFEEKPVRSIAEARERIESLTGIRRSQSQVRQFMIRHGLRWQRMGAVPVPPKKKLEEHVAEQKKFHDEELQPLLDAAKNGKGHVFFVDAAHFVFGTFLCCMWSFTRIFVRAASGRQRFNVLGAWNAITQELITVTNTTVVNRDTMCELLRKISAQKLVGPVTLVLDNARYQHNTVVKELAEDLKIKLLFLPPYSPNLNLIERLWKFIRNDCLYGKYYGTFQDFRGSIEGCIEKLPKTHRNAMKTLMTLKFQTFENVILVAA